MPGPSQAPTRAALPAPLVARARRARIGLEIGAGRDFATALALAEAAPNASWIVSDVDERVRHAPRPLRALVLDVTRPDLVALPDADLVYAVRLPEELQPACARLARELRADLALRPLKDEWADITASFKRSVVWPDGWRFFPLA